MAVAMLSPFLLGSGLLKVDDLALSVLGYVEIGVEVGGGGISFDIYATSTGAIGLLLIFGLFGRKRRESFLDAERRKMHGEGSLWDDH